jgi:hypothetical protein
MIGAAALTNLFTYHAPHGDQPLKYTKIRAAGLHMAMAIDENAPDGPDKDEAMRLLRAAVMWANAGIACAPHPADAS